MSPNRKDFWEFFIYHRRFTIIIVIAALLLGIFSIIQIPKESNPEVDVPIALVTTIFPGASAGEVEELVTDILEDRILSLEDLEEVTSTSGEGISVIAIQFDARVNSDEKVDELKDKVDEIIINLPDEAEDPIVKKIRFSDEPILSLSLSGPFQVPQLKQFAEELEEDIESIFGVSKVDVFGGQEREIQVIVDKPQLDAIGLSISQVTNAIRLANADIPTGAIETGGVRYSLRLTGRVLSAEEVKRIPVAAVNNTPIFVGDVAQVIDGYSEKTTISRLGLNSSEPLPAVSLSIFKTSGGNILDVVDNTFRIIKEAKLEYLPGTVNVESIRNDAEFIRDDLGTLVKSGIGTVIIVFILLWLFLGLREALLAGIAIPLSFLITFIFLSAIGSTINFLTLFSLILALGILIDSSIVIVEGMHRYIISGRTPKEAAVSTVRDFKMPLIAGTLTTVFAFVPMLLMSGILGEFVKHIPITVTIVLLSSLFVALGVVTTLGVSWLKLKTSESTVYRQKETFFARLCRKFFNFCGKFRAFERIEFRYGKVLLALLRSKKHQRILTVVVTLAFIFSLALPITGALEVNMFPAEDFDFFFIDISLPVGAPLEETSEVSKEVEEILANDPRVKSFAVTIGAGSMVDDTSTLGPASHLANAFVNLNEERKDSSLDIIEQYQNEFNKKINADVSVIQLGSGPPSGAPVEIAITGPSLETLEALAKRFETFLEEIPGARNIKTTIQEPTGEFLINIDRAKAQLFGINTIQLAQVLRNAVSGTVATEVRREGEEIDVLVKYALSPRFINEGKTNITDINSIEALTIATPRGSIPLSEFTTIKLGGGRPAIQHKDGDRIMRVTSETKKDVSAQSVFASVAQKMKTINIPSKYEVKLGGEQEDIEQSYSDMFRAMILAIFLIAGALVLQFNSFRQPLFIMATIPLAFIGVFSGLVFMDLPLSFPGIIGVVALVGIVVNNAIILISRINENRFKNMLITESVIEASKSRLQPIVLTTITTVVGILPVTLSSELWGPLGFSIIFGLSFSAFLTLFIVPFLYNRFAEKRLE
jgi:HAE1 family hydrophobic/amphiphilic exporter-1